MVMKFLDGMTLKHRIGSRPIELEAVLSLGIEIADSPWHQAGKYFCHQAWAGEGSGFRAGESNASGVTGLVSPPSAMPMTG